MISRRLFCGVAGIGPLAWNRLARAQALSAVERRPMEWSFVSNKAYPDPFNAVELDVMITDPKGTEQRVPAFWAGEDIWRVRCAPGGSGRYRYKTICTDTSNAGLHGRAGLLDVVPYEGDNPLYRHGPIRVAGGRRHFEHADGTPFFWLGDTNWMGLCRRLQWPDEFQLLAADRRLKGFTVIQIVAGLYPDMPPFDPRGANEAGYPWEKDYGRINPSYFDMADLRIQCLVDRGFVPCIVGCWGYFLPLMGTEKMKQHWRYLIARWGCYPVVWCLAGEGTMPYYLSKTREQDMSAQKKGWTDVARYVRGIDPYHHLITIHPMRTAHDSVEDPAVLDFDMLQTGHGGRASIPNTVKTLTDSIKISSGMPVLVGEVAYEGIGEDSRQEVQRFMFWSCMLSGAAGHTYGANGIWQLDRPDQPFGPSPHGQSWGGDVPWTEAYQLPGSHQVGLGKGLLLRYPWWRLEPHPELIEPHWTTEDYVRPYAAAIPTELVIVFIPFMPANRRLPVKVKGLQIGRSYRAFFFNPSTGREHEIGTIQPEPDGTWQAPPTPIIRDWVLVVEKGV